jgi:hypothetical protein
MDDRYHARGSGMSGAMNDYQKEQLDTLETVRSQLVALGEVGRIDLLEMAADYLNFRRRTDRFLAQHFSGICSESCYRGRLSACCSKDGIITFFADVVINALFSPDPVLDRIATRLSRANTGFKCVYLSEDGCRWRIKPIVCQMFICDAALAKAFEKDPAAADRWERLKAEKKTFTWPDRPVLFDRIEGRFISAGCASSLMYLHNSPGLLRVKRRAGLTAP